MKFVLQAITVQGPGLNGWEDCKAKLQGHQTWTETTLSVPRPALLPANERRRLTPCIQLALALAEEVCADLQPSQRADLLSVFASSIGDSDIVHRLCSALAQADRPVSPTQFHNSVHNAPAGYWAIAAATQAPSNSLAAGVWTAGAGLMELQTLADHYQRPAMLVIYDALPPEPMQTLVGITHGFGMAIRIAPMTHKERSLAYITTDWCNTAATILPAPWESLRHSNPAAQHLSLAYALANGLDSVILTAHAHANLALKIDYA